MSSTGGTAIGVVNGNVTIVRGQSSPQIQKILGNLNALKQRGAVNDSELKSLIDIVNQSILPELASIKGDTTEIRARLEAIEKRLSLAAQNPEMARDVLRPYLKPQLDLTNSSYDINEFLDVNGRSEYRLIFQVRGVCQIYVNPPYGTGFKVGYAVLSDRESIIFRALQGTQPRSPRPISVSSGTYQFVLYAKREAGQYSATINARCDSE